MAEERKWDNFKNEVAQRMGRDGPEYAVALHEVWRITYPFTLTMGWLEDGDKKLYFHAESYLEQLLSGMKTKDYLDGLQLHFWLNSPAMEILDVCLYTMVGKASKNEGLVAGVVY